MIKLVIIAVCAAIVVVAVSLILGPIVRQVETEMKQPGIGDLAATAASDYLSAQMTQAAYTPTPGIPGPSAAEVAATIAAIPINAAATQQAETRRQEALLATQDARAASLQSTQQAQVRYDQATQAAQVQATKEYWRMLAWSATQTTAALQTQQAYPATQTAYAWTQTAIPLIATSEAGRLMAEQTVVAGQAIDMDRKVRQQAWAGPGGTFIMWIVLIGSLGLAGYAVYQMKRVRKLTPDGQGYLLDNGKNGQQVVNLALMPTPVISVTQPGKVSNAGDTDYQREVTRQAQGVQALRAVASGQTQPRDNFGIVNEVMGGGTQRFALSEPPAELVGGDAARALNLDWQANDGS